MINSDERTNRLAAEILARVPDVMRMTGDDDFAEIVELALADLIDDLEDGKVTLDGIDPSDINDDDQGLVKCALVLAHATLTVDTSTVN